MTMRIIAGRHLSKLFFLLALLAFSVIVSVAQTSSPKKGFTGCFLSAGGSVNPEKSALTTIRPWAHNQAVADYLDRFVLVHANWVNMKFVINPSVAYFDDGRYPNAYASSVNTHGATDGSIRLGVNLVYSELKWIIQNAHDRARAAGKDDSRLTPEDWGDPYGVVAIMAHEGAHILQMKNGVGNPSRNTELQADFLAGWYIGDLKRTFKKDFEKYYYEVHTIIAFHSRGDYQFNAVDHHGTPVERMRAFEAGFKIGKLKLPKAWQKSLEYRNTLGG